MIARLELSSKKNVVCTQAKNHHIIRRASSLLESITWWWWWWWWCVSAASSSCRVDALFCVSLHIPFLLLLPIAVYDYYKQEYSNNAADDYDDE
jgi:hypothetical protein